ncbi:hypothetical protein LCGC14_2643280 [marine sediment metagenome]|uniref:Uncharacterized protein n=1 Tax=marine sediment metagenome TaxID=412755 RepID=A0A0F9CP48_9ZZZZ
MTDLHLEVPDECVEFLYNSDTGEIRFRPMMTDNPTHGGHVEANVARRFYGSDPVPYHLLELAKEHLRSAGLMKEVDGVA